MTDLDLSAYLAPPGRCPGVGPERGKPRADGIARFVSSHGSTRYVGYVRGEAVAALQVVSRDGAHAQIANVYTLPRERRKGWAKRLLVRAKRDFRTVVHAEDSMLSEDAKAWRARIGMSVHRGRNAGRLVPMAAR